MFFHTYTYEHEPGCSVENWQKKWVAINGELEGYSLDDFTTICVTLGGFSYNLPNSIVGVL